MAKSIKVEDLGAAIEQELTVYHENLVERVNQLSEAAVQELVKKTKATAPEGNRGKFKRSIAGKLLTESRRGNKYVWYVKGKEYRLTHLLVHGHATKNGGRTKGNPFLHNALNEVIPKYEKNVKEAIESGK